ncbi:DUF447 domain-containing protein [Halobacterium litoreum]|uniref:DUF447 domain-containing protein n=1 Tax=Halobacterium litoreum TaxID=2039234 RepID=A0ABD5ND06_9EURY|nr:DUF447 domain-containing protein [Halobacterium litoreum]UHH14109.1 DUF447 family protein [Halobacterium litoreum]
MTDPDGKRADWPVELRGVTETVVATRGPNDRWNLAALGVHAPADGGPATATTFGNTRTRRNFHREGGGYVQFVDDPVVFADAALSISESEESVVEGATAWARVDAEQTGSEADGDTRLEHWALRPVESDVVRESPFAVNRGFYAVVETTVAASRLGVDGYDTETLRERLRYFADVARNCGGDREREAIERVREHADGDW